MSQYAQCAEQHTRPRLAMLSMSNQIEGRLNMLEAVPAYVNHLLVAKALWVSVAPRVPFQHVS